jgi:metallo-beta-lactamase family protein
MKISFHGAARGVTGSCHLVTCGETRILIDCGMFQGGHELAEENEGAFGFEPADVDFLLLTHAHLDHCGRIPLLVKRGFKGEIVTTHASRDLARLVLLDSAHLHEEEARRRTRHSKRRTFEPLYDTVDALDSLDYFTRTARYREPMELAPGVTATFVNAGHILGSASILLELTERGRRRRVLFSGDLGGPGSRLLADAEPPGDVDIVVMETTYGDRLHRSLEASVAEFNHVVTTAYERGGNIIIPTFALERAQELLFFLREGMHNKAIPSRLAVFLDSPMAISATQIFGRHTEDFRPEVAEIFAAGKDPFKPPHLHFLREASESMALDRVRSGALIMAGSGMCTGGRVRFHLRQNLSHADNSVIFVGFAAKHTLARIIIDGATKVKLFGDEIPVRANIHTINGFSAHADRDELLDWHARTGSPETTFLVHGESRVMDKFARRLKKTRVEKPKAHEVFEI